jgi:hypothetical protein
MNNTFYTLSFAAKAGSVIDYIDPVTGNNQKYRVPASGRVVCYVGQTGMPLKDRLSKHNTYLNKMLDWNEGYEVIGVKHYPLYEFLATNEVFPENDELHIDPIAFGTDEKDYLEERMLIQSFRQAGLPMMNVNQTEAQTRNMLLAQSYSH